jgi:hypothetical protein
MKALGVLAATGLMLFLGGCCYDGGPYRESARVRREMRREAWQAHQNFRSDMQRARDDFRRHAYEAREDLRRSIRENARENRHDWRYRYPQ